MEPAVVPDHVLFRRFQQVGGDLPRLVPDPAGGHRRGGTGRGRAAAGVGTQPVGRGIGIAFLHQDVIHGDAQLVGDDLGEGGLVALALVANAGAHQHLAGGMDPDLAGVEHLDAGDVEGVAGTGADDLGEGGHADPHELAAPALLFLLAAQVPVADEVHRLLEGGRVVPAVVGPPQRRPVRELLRRDEVLHAQLHRIHPQLVGQHVHGPLDQVRRLGDPEGAAVGDTAGRLVGVDAVHLREGRREVVGTGDDAEQAGGELGRVGGRVEGAVVRHRLHPQGLHPPVPARGDLARHVVVPGETGALQVLGPGLHPLDGPAQLQRGHHGADVARVDRHLVAETAAHVRRDHPDLVLRQPGDQRQQGAVRVGRLRGDVEGEPPRGLVVVGDATTGLQGRGMNAGEVDLLPDDHLGLGEGTLGPVPVAHLPVPDVVGLLLPVLAHQGRPGLQRLEGVDHHRQGLVLHLLGQGVHAVEGRFPRLGDDRGHLLPLEQDLAHGQHHLPVARQRGHPGEAGLVQVLAGDHRDNPGNRQRRFFADRADPGMGIRAAHDAHVEHARKHDVVQIPPGALDEARVFLALDALAQGSLSDRHQSLPPRVFGSAAAATPSAAVAAAGTSPRNSAAACWIALTMFW